MYCSYTSRICCRLSACCWSWLCFWRGGAFCRLQAMMENFHQYARHSELGRKFRFAKPLASSIQAYWVLKRRVSTVQTNPLLEPLQWENVCCCPRISVIFTWCHCALSHWVEWSLPMSALGLTWFAVNWNAPLILCSCYVCFFSDAWQSLVPNPTRPMAGCCRGTYEGVPGGESQSRGEFY